MINVSQAAEPAPPAVASAQRSHTPRGSIRHFTRRPEAAALAGTVAVFVFFSIFGGQDFLSAGGVSSWLNVAAELAVVVIPVGALMIAGEIDLSIGSVLAASSVTMAIVSGYFHLPAIVGIIAALGLGALTGLVNGLVVARTNVPSFIVTLAMNFGLAGLTLGLARLITGTTSVGITLDPVAKAVLGSLLGGKFEVAIFWAIGVALVGAWILQASKYGNWIFAVGGDNVSARAAGVPVAAVKISLFVATGVGAALVGVIQTATYNSAQTISGQALVFNAIIATVVGGVLLTGGYGSVIGVVFGTLTFAIVNQGIYYTGWNSDWANLILGVLILAAVLMSNTFRRLALSGGARSNVKGA